MKKGILALVALVLVAALLVVGYRVWQRTRVQQTLSKAEEDLRAGRYGEAARGFGLVWERDSTSVKAISGLIESKFRLGAYREVVDFCAKTHEVPNLPPRVVTFKAWSELKLSDIDTGRRDIWFDRAKASFDEAVVRDSRNPEAYVGRGWISLQESGLDLSSPMTGFRPVGRYDRSEVEMAAKNFQRGLELRRGYPDASLGLAIIAHSEDRTQDVGKLFEGLVGSGETDVVLIQSLILLSLDPSQAEAVKDRINGMRSVPYASQRALRFCILGMTDYLLGNLESAQRHFNTACANDAEFRFPGIRFHLAKVEEARGNWGPAREELEDLRKEPRFRTDSSVLFLLALNAYHRGESSEMEWLLKEVQGLRPGAPDVLLFRASEEQNEIKRGDLYLEILEVDPENFLARYNLGTIRLRLEDTRAAIEHLKVALRSRPDFRDGRLNLANALRQARRFEEAAEEYTAALEQWPELDDAKLGLALVRLEQGDREGAVDLLEQVTKEGTLGAMAQLLLARGALADGDTAEAIEFAQQAVDLDPGSYQARTFLGNLYLEGNQPAKAVPQFQEASRNPNDVFFPDALNGLAVAYYVQDKYSQAMDELDRVIRRADEWGNTAAFFVNRGNVFFRLRKYAEAEADYTKAQQTDRASAIASYNLGVLKERLGQRERARFQYEEATRREPKFPWAHFNLGNLHAANQDRRVAIEEYRKATEDDPELDEAYVNLAIQLIEGQDYSEAVEHLERASERNPGSTVIHNALAIIHLQMKDLAEAEQECTRSLKAEPLNPTARLLMGLVRINQSQFSAAYGLLSDIPRTPELGLSLQCSLGITQVSLGKVRAGITNLESAAVLARGTARGRRFLADALVNQAWGLLHHGEYGQALEVLQEAAQNEEPEVSDEIRITLRKLEKV